MDEFRMLKWLEKSRELIKSSIAKIPQSISVDQKTSNIAEANHEKYNDHKKY